MDSFKLQSVCVMALLLTALSRTVQTVTVCPVNSQRFISTDTNLLPTTNIRASSEDALFNPVANFIEPSSSPWCTAEEEGEMAGHFVELTFTEPIVVQLLQSSGFVNGYVSNFTILSSMSATEDDFKAYGILEESQSFLVESPLFDEGYFTMEQPIVARRLKFVINGGVLEQAGRLCWEISIYGCTLATAETVQILQTTEPISVTVTTPIASMSTDPLSMTTVTAKECPPPDVPNITSQNDILMIALPIALATIVIVLFLVILGILICICVTRRRDLKEPDYDTVTVKMLNNRTRQIIEGGDPNSGTNFHYDSPRLLSYDVPRAARSRGGSLSVSSTDALNSPLSYEIKNPVYSIKRSCAPDTPLQLALMNMPDGSSCSNDYETIPEGVTSTENKLYSLHRSHSQPQSNPPNNNNNTITTPVSIASSSDLSTMKEQLETGDNASVESARSSTTPKQMTYDYASVNKSGLASNRRGTEPPREGSSTPIFETLYESTDQENDAN